MITSDIRTRRSLVKKSESRFGVDMAMTVSPHQKGDGSNRNAGYMCIFLDCCPFYEGDIIRTNNYQYLIISAINRVDDFFDEHYQVYVNPVVDSDTPIKDVRWVKMIRSTRVDRPKNI